MTQEEPSRSVARVARVVAVAAGGLLLFAGWVARDAGSALVVRKHVEDPDAIVVPASHEWERLPAAAHLARKTLSAAVVLTRPCRPSKANCHLCEGRATWLVHLGLSPERIVVVSPCVRRTLDEARAVIEYGRQRRWTRIVVVTSPYHTRRALGAFQRVEADGGIIVGVEPALIESGASPREWWRHGYDRAYVFYEWSALLMYRLRFGVAL